MLFSMKIPNLLTLLRILLIPVFVVVYYLPGDWSPWLAASIFALAAITDWLDGYLARRLNQQSPFGAFLDPVADKLMVTVALILIVQRNPEWLLALSSAIIIGREITVSALREWMASLGESGRVKVAWTGKIKTILQMVAIGFLLFREDLLGLPILQIGIWLLVIAAALTIISMISYLRAAWPAVRRQQ